ncbi:MAG: hypothetical protein ACFN04_01315 [Propionibacterium acidifaciens]
MAIINRVRHRTIIGGAELLCPEKLIDIAATLSRARRHVLPPHDERKRR